jgi:enolase
MVDVDSSKERAEVEGYMTEHQLEDSLNEIINTVVQDKPVDPYVVFADLLKAKSKAQKGILFIQGHEILDSNGEPTLQVEITTNKGVFSASVANKRAGKGPRDAPILNDGEEERYDGRGVQKAIKAISDLIAPDLLGLDPMDQTTIDDILSNKAQSLLPEAEEGDDDYVAPEKDDEGQDIIPKPKHIGVNTTLAISIAVCKAGAKHADKMLYEYIALLAGRQPDNTSVPMPIFNVISGGLHASTKNYVQELCVMPVGAETFAEALKIGYDVHKFTKRGIVEEVGQTHANAGITGGLAPHITPEEALDILVAATEKAGHTEKVKFYIDMAASQITIEAEEDEGAGVDDPQANDEPPKYDVDKFDDEQTQELEKDSDDLIDMYKDWKQRYPVISIEDPFDRKDWDSYFRLKNAFENEGQEEAEGGEGEAAGGGGEDDEEDADADAPTFPPIGGDESCPMQVVADELFSVPEDLEKAHDENCINTMTLDPYSRATVMQSVTQCVEAQEYGWGIVVDGSRPGETLETFVCDLAVGMQAGQFKCGALVGSENTAKFNHLSRIALAPTAPPFVGAHFRAHV